MELKVIHYVDESDLKVVASRHFINDEECSSEDFTELLIGCIDGDADDEFEEEDDDDDDDDDFEDDVIECDDDCENCEFCEDCDKDEDEDLDESEDKPNDSDKAELEMLLNWADTIEENDLCFGCIFNTVAEAFYAGKDIGYRNAKLETIEQLSNEIEDMD